jgi:hypothetical protein
MRKIGEKTMLTDQEKKTLETIHQRLGELHQELKDVAANHPYLGPSWQAPTITPPTIGKGLHEAIHRLDSAGVELRGVFKLVHEEELQRVWNEAHAGKNAHEGKHEADPG